MANATYTLISQYPPERREQLARRAYYYWLNFWAYTLLPLARQATLDAQLPVIRDKASASEAAQQLLLFVLDRLTKAKTKDDCRVALLLKEIRHPMKSDVDEFARSQFVRLKTGKDENAAANKALLRRLANEPASSFGFVVDDDVSAQAAYDTPSQPALLGPVNLGPLTLRAGRGSPDKFFDSPFKSLAAVKSARNNASTSADESDYANYLLMLPLLHREIESQLAAMQQQGFTSELIAGVAKAYRQALGGKHPLAPRENAKRMRRGGGTREDRRESTRLAMREQSQLTEESALQEARWLDLHDTLAQPIALSPTRKARGLKADPRNEARLYDDLLNVLDEVDLGSLTQQQFEDLKRTLVSFYEYVRDHTDQPYGTTGPVGRLGFFTDLLRQDRLLDERSKGLIRKVQPLAARGLHYAGRMTPIPDRITKIFSDPMLLSAFRNELGEQEGKELVWTVMTSNAGLDLPFPADLTYEDLADSKLIEYGKMVDKWGPACNNVYNYRGLRLFGTFDELEKYYDKWREKLAEEDAHPRDDDDDDDDDDYDYDRPRLHTSSGTRGADIANWLHDDGGFAALTLPTEGKWDRRAWATFVNKYGPKVVRYVANAPTFQEKLGGKAPTDLNVFRQKCFTGTPDSTAFLALGVPKSSLVKYEALFEKIAGSPKKIIEAQDLTKPISGVTYRTKSAKGETIEKNPFTFKVLDKFSPVAPVLGLLLNNCQHLDGAASSLVEVATISPEAGFAVIEHKDEIVAAVCFWIADDRKTLVFDSIEARSDYRHEYFRKNVLVPMLIESAQNLIKKYGFENIYIGAGGFAGTKFNDLVQYPQGEFVMRMVERPARMPARWGNNIYSGDSAEQMTLLPEGYAKKYLARANASKRRKKPTPQRTPSRRTPSRMPRMPRFF